MKLKEIAKIILLVGSIATLAACSSGRKPQGDQYAVSDANAEEGVEAAGTDDTEGFHKSSSASRVSAKNTYYFDYDSNIVHEDDKSAIEANANKLSSAASKVMLEGHTDPRGSREYNIGLGERRAKAIADVLRSNGVNPSQIRLVSYGAEKLASPGQSEQDYQLDRRVVLVNVK